MRKLYSGLFFDFSEMPPSTTTAKPMRCVEYPTQPSIMRPLLDQMDNTHEPWRWQMVKSRIEDNWKYWLQAAQTIQEKQKGVGLVKKHVSQTFTIKIIYEFDILHFL